MKISVSNLFLPGWLLCAALLTAAPASAASSRCVENGDIVSLDGVASADIRAQGGRPAWVLHLSRPVCVNVGSRHAPVEEMFAIRIIGTPPPLGIPLQLTGKLLLAGTSPGPAMFAALAVIRGRKETNADALAPPPSGSAAAPMHSGLPSPRAAAGCGSPPYGGTQTQYRVFVKRFGQIIKPEKILAGICNAKFGRVSRDGLHKLGFTDAKIESENTEQLAAETIVALKKLVHTIE